MRRDQSATGTQTCQDVLEGKFDVAGVKGRGLNERQVVLAYVAVSATHSHPPGEHKENILANCLASSVGTARRCLKSLLFPTSMMTMLESA